MEEGFARSPAVEGYQVGAVLGRGGFSTVYRAVQMSVGRPVALKVLEAWDLDPELERRFRAECQAVGALSWHPNIVAIHDAGTAVDGRPFMSMELFEQGSLADRIKANGPMDPFEVRRVGVDVAEALVAAQQAGIVHRDIKPANILVGRRGAYALGDFGIAAFSDSTKSATGNFSGTLAFTAPEVLMGSRADARSDVFSLGVTLHTLLSGVSSFAADTSAPGAVIHRVINEPLPPLAPHVPLSLVTVIDRAASKDPARRYVTAEAMLQALQGDETVISGTMAASREDGAAGSTAAAEADEATMLRSTPPTSDATVIRPTPQPPNTPFGTVPPDKSSSDEQPVNRPTDAPAGTTRKWRVAALVLLAIAAALVVLSLPTGLRALTILGVMVAWSASMIFIVDRVFALPSARDGQTPRPGTARRWTKPLSIGATIVGALVIGGLVWRLSGGSDAPSIPLSDDQLVRQLVADDGTLWAIAGGQGSDDEQKILRIDPSTGEVDELRALNGQEDSTYEIATHDGVLWLRQGSFESDTPGRLTKLDSETGQELAGTELPGFASLIAAGADGVWTVTTDPDSFETQIVRIDPVELSVTDSLSIGLSFAQSLAVTATAVWVLTDPAIDSESDSDWSNAQLVRIDPATFEVIATIELSGAAASSMALDTYGESVWVSVERGGPFDELEGSRLLRVDAATNEVVVDSELPDYVNDLFIDGGSLVTQLLLRTDDKPSGSSVQRRDPFTGEVIETLEFSNGDIAGALAADTGIEFWAQIFRFEAEVAVDPRIELLEWTDLPG
jgi:serine/threonine protein kinase